MRSRAPVMRRASLRRVMRRALLRQAMRRASLRPVKLTGWPLPEPETPCWWPSETAMLQAMHSAWPAQSRTVQSFPVMRGSTERRPRESKTRYDERSEDSGAQSFQCSPPRISCDVQGHTRWVPMPESLSFYSHIVVH